jgi:GNAT superfamily N-acetyltransferase
VLNKDWDSVSRNTIGEILDRGARVVVAVVDLDGGGRRVLGYSVSEPAHAVLHWLYVKDTYRRMGVGRALLAETLRSLEPGGAPRWEYTHRTPSSEPFFRACGFRLTHNPVPARVKR